MNTRMERVAQDVAQVVLRMIVSAAKPPLQPEALKAAFQAKWPTPDSRTPMTDAMSAAAQAADACTGQGPDSWKTAVSQAWQPAVDEAVEEYFKAARRSFRQGEPLEGVETLTDAVRATLGHIAAVRDWPHSAHDDLYCIAAALGSGSGWPGTMEEFERALDNASEEGKHLGSTLGASMGRPRMLKFGVYAERPEGAEEDGFLFATTAIELANRLAGQTPARA